MVYLRQNKSNIIHTKAISMKYFQYSVPYMGMDGRTDPYTFATFDTTFKQYQIFKLELLC